MFQRSLKVSAAISGVVLMAGYASAAVVTIDGVTFDDALTANTGSIILGAPTSAGISATSGWSPNGSHAGFDLITVGSQPTEGADLGDGTTREIIRLSWAGQYLKDQTGDDFVVAEQGGSGSVEAFAVALKPVGGGITGYYHFIEDGASNQHFLTSFNITDFGLVAGTSIEYIQIENLLAADVKNSAGLIGTGAGFTITPIPGGEDITGVYESGSFDPDAGYALAVGSANLVAIPEPASLSLLGLGALGLIRRRRAV